MSKNKDNEETGLIDPIELTTNDSAIDLSSGLNMSDFTRVERLEIIKQMEIIRNGPVTTEVYEGSDSRDEDDSILVIE